MGINGAAIGSVICHILACGISFIYLKKELKIKIDVSKFILKPLLATVLTMNSSYFIYGKIILLLNKSFATIISVLVAIIIYVVLIIVFNILNKEEMEEIPFGDKLYKFSLKLKEKNV